MGGWVGDWVKGVVMMDTVLGVTFRLLLVQTTGSLQFFDKNDGLFHRIHFDGASLTSLLAQTLS